MIRDPKTPQGRRNIALTSIAVEALKRRRLAQYQERLAAGPAWEDLDLVFSNLVGRPRDPSHLRHREFPSVLRRAGLPAIRFHDLRHSTATLLLSMGVHPKVVQELLGHSQISTTMDIYSHVMPHLQADAMRDLDRLLGQ